MDELRDTAVLRARRAEAADAAPEAVPEESEEVEARESLELSGALARARRADGARRVAGRTGTPAADGEKLFFRGRDSKAPAAVELFGTRSATGPMGPAARLHLRLPKMKRCGWEEN